jgi:hypothetical protein
MGDDNGRVGHESGDGIAFDFMARSHFVANAVQLDRGFWITRLGSLSPQYPASRGSYY